MLCNSNLFVRHNGSTLSRALFARRERPSGFAAKGVGSSVLLDRFSETAMVTHLP